MPKKSRTAQNNPVYKKAQAAAIVQRKIMGDSMDQIAATFQMSRDTVERRLKFAERSGILQDAAQRVLEELVPLAHSAYVQALIDGDITAAKDVMYGTGILSKNNKAQVAPAAETVEMTLAVYREQRKQAYVKTADEGGDETQAVPAAAGVDAAIVGEILGEEHGSYDLPFDRPEEWPPLPAGDEASEGDEEGDS